MRDIKFKMFPEQTCRELQSLVVRLEYSANAEKRMAMPSRSRMVMRR